MDTIYRGGLETPAGRRRAWLDSLLVDHGLLRLGWTNAGAVVPGRLYRSNHPTPARLTAMVRRWGIRTVLNLRGRTGNGSDALSRERAAELGLDFVDVPFSSGQAPTPERVLALAEALRTMREPGLVHCKSGADRAGFAGVLFLLLNGVPVAAAMDQLSLRWGHFSRSRSGVLDEFFRAYARQGEARLPFLDWVRDEYDPASVTAAHKGGRLAGVVQERLLRRE
jgi:protein tyrosine/serine phosphatase